MSEAYLIPTDFEDCLKYCKGLNMNRLPRANVLAVFDGGYYLLAEVTPPSDKCLVFIAFSGETVEWDVRDLFYTIQEQNVVAWCKI